MYVILFLEKDSIFILILFIYVLLCYFVFDTVGINPWSKLYQG